MSIVDTETDKYICMGKNTQTLLSILCVAFWRVAGHAVVTIMGEVTDFAAGITFLRGCTSAIVQVLSVALGDSGAFPAVLSVLFGAGSLFVVLNEFLPSLSASEAKLPKMVARRSTWRPTCLAKASLSYRVDSFAVSSTFDKLASFRVARSLSRATVSVKSMV